MTDPLRQGVFSGSFTVPLDCQVVGNDVLSERRVAGKNLRAKRKRLLPQGAPLLIARSVRDRNGL